MATCNGVARRSSIRLTSIFWLIHSFKILKDKMASLSYFTKRRWMMFAPIDVRFVGLTNAGPSFSIRRAIPNL